MKTYGLPWREQGHGVVVNARGGIASQALTCPQPHSCALHACTCVLHRYYGKSLPYGKDVRKHMQYLSAEQVRAGSCHADRCGTLLTLQVLCDACAQLG